jgi:hypothetical protein
MVMDLNEAAEQRDFGALIPDGTFVKLKGHIRPGRINLAGAPEADNGLFKAGKPPSDAIMLDWEFTVMHGTHAKQKIWQNTVVAGGTLDERGQSKAGNITKAMFRAMLESALGINPKDTSEEARQKRILECFSHLDGIEFAARIGVQEGGAREGGGNFPDQNRIAFVVTPDQDEWQPVMNGQEVAPKPSGALKARTNGAAAAAANKPAWQSAAAPAQAASTPSPAWQQRPTVSPPAPQAPVAGGNAAQAGPTWLNR